MAMLQTLKSSDEVSMIFEVSTAGILMIVVAYMGFQIQREVNSWKRRVDELSGRKLRARRAAMTVAAVAARLAGDRISVDIESWHADLRIDNSGRKRGRRYLLTYALGLLVAALRMRLDDMGAE